MFSKISERLSRQQILREHDGIVRLVVVNNILFGRCHCADDQGGHEEEEDEGRHLCCVVSVSLSHEMRLEAHLIGNRIFVLDLCINREMSGR